MKAINTPKLSRKTVFVFRSAAKRDRQTTDPTTTTLTIITTTHDGNLGKK
ncbi:hypothetical protein [Pedobacter sp. GR22-10]|nr:hypothetical protein [Pedobacter sp. GR22-10]MCX2429602.1 hypothetical protein [Pedobacter sp. GR22-10]